MMELKIVSLAAEYAESGYNRFRNLEKGLKCIEMMLRDHDSSDFILLPAGFITQQDRKENNIKRVIESCEKYKDVLITGIDSFSTSGMAVVINGEGHYFKQACIYSSEIPDISIDEERSFQYNGLDFSVVCCGEFFNYQFRREVFDKDKLPDMIFGAVHLGKSFQHGTYKLKLNEYSKCVSFYTYHLKCEPSGILSGAVEEGRSYKSGLGWIIRYKIDRSKRYKFSVNRQIAED